jgi:GH24 family phage-related lysozyme (muramidase)
MDYNGDTTDEIFTVVKAFEGYNYNVYSRQDGKWTRIFEGYNYHCAY